MIFLYKITNLVNNKIYVGVHSGDPNDNYLGSGLHIKRAIKKYGITNFNRKILIECETEKEAYDIESILVDDNFIKRIDTYNLKTGGRGGWSCAVKYGDDNVMRRSEVARKVSDSIKASITPEERKRRSDRMKENRQNGTVKARPAGWKMTEEQKEKLSKKLTGKSNPLKGKKRGPDSEESRNNKRAAAIKRSATRDMGALTRGKKFVLKDRTCPHYNLIGKGGNMTKYHFDNCKMKPQNE